MVVTGLRAMELGGSSSKEGSGRLLTVLGGSSSKKLGTLRTDRGGEFNVRTFANYCAEEGI